MVYDYCWANLVAGESCTIRAAYSAVPAKGKVYSSGKVHAVCHCGGGKTPEIARDFLLSWDVKRSDWLADRLVLGELTVPQNTTTLRHESKTMATIAKRYDLVDFASVPGVQCACGMSHRALEDAADFPATIHVTDISANARTHYHKRLTETYYFLECGPEAQMQLDDDIVPVRPGMCILIRPGVRHRAIGRMRVLIVVLPKYDPADEWFD